MKRRIEVRAAAEPPLNAHACTCPSPAPLAVLQTDKDGTLPMASLGTEEKHGFVEKEKAIAMGFKPTARNECKYEFCPWVENMKKQKCGEKSARMQEGRPKTSLFCIHPKCQCGYHALCYSFAHKLLE